MQISTPWHGRGKKTVEAFIEEIIVFTQDSWNESERDTRYCISPSVGVGAYTQEFFTLYTNDLLSILRMYFSCSWKYCDVFDEGNKTRGKHDVV